MKSQTLMAASGTEEESAPHKVALEKILHMFTLYKCMKDNAYKTERYPLGHGR